MNNTAAPVALNWWTPKPANAVLDYYLDVSNDVTPEQDYIMQATAVVAPAGEGELDLRSLYVEGFVMRVTVLGGQPSRIYNVRFDVLMATGRQLSFRVNMAIPTELPGYRIPLPPVPGYGPPLLWRWMSTLDFSNPLNGGYAAMIGVI